VSSCGTGPGCTAGTASAPTGDTGSEPPGPAADRRCDALLHGVERAQPGTVGPPQVAELHVARSAGTRRDDLQTGQEPADLCTGAEHPRAHRAVQEHLLHAPREQAELIGLRVEEVCDHHEAAAGEGVDGLPHQLGAVIPDVVVQRADLEQADRLGEVEQVADGLVPQHLGRSEDVGVHDPTRLVACEQRLAVRDDRGVVVHVDHPGRGVDPARCASAWHATGSCGPVSPAAFPPAGGAGRR
jgi:hypothetical protein